MRIRRVLGAAIVCAFAVGSAGHTALAVTPEPVTAAAPHTKVGGYFEQHRFSGSSTSAAALQEWMTGKEYVEPVIETYDLTEFKVNKWQTARAGDVIIKDDNGSFWVLRPATRR